MKQVVLNIPDSLDLSDKEATLLLASRLYEKGKLSLGQAAEMAGLSKKTFAELLSQFDVSIFNYPPTDLARDIKNA